MPTLTQRLRAIVKAAKAYGRKFASTQFEIAEGTYAEAGNLLRNIQAGIDDADIAADGKEDNLHITIKYGLHTADAAEVARLVAGFGPVEVVLTKVSYFAAKSEAEFDVVKVDVDSQRLQDLNALLSTLPHTDTHPTYQPHVTLAYVKPGLGEVYTDSPQAGLEGLTLSFGAFTFSPANGENVTIPLIADMPLAKRLRTLLKSRDASNHEHAADGKFTSGSGGSGSGDKPGTAKPSKPKPDRPKTEQGIHETATTTAQGFLRKMAGKIAALPKATVQKSVSVCKSLYAKAEKKYGPRWAKAIVGTAIVTMPTPFTMGSVALMTGLAHVWTKYVSGRPGEKSGDELDMEEVERLAAELLEEMRAAVRDVEDAGAKALGRIKRLLKGEWQEDKHPRDHGKFSSKPGEGGEGETSGGDSGGGDKPKPKPGKKPANKPAHPEGLYKIDGEIGYVSVGDKEAYRHNTHWLPTYSEYVSKVHGADGDKLAETMRDNGDHETASEAIDGYEATFSRRWEAALTQAEDWFRETATEADLNAMRERLEPYREAVAEAIEEMRGPDWNEEAEQWQDEDRDEAIGDATAKAKDAAAEAFAEIGYAADELRQEIKDRDEAEDDAWKEELEGHLDDFNGDAFDTHEDALANAAEVNAGLAESGNPYRLHHDGEAWAYDHEEDAGDWPGKPGKEGKSLVGRLKRILKAEWLGRLKHGGESGRPPGLSLGGRRAAESTPPGI